MPPSKSRQRAVDSALAQWLVEHRRTQVWLSLKLGISVATMSRIVRGATMPRSKLALRIKRVTGVTGDDLLRAKATNTADNRAARVQKAKALITRGSAMLAAVSEEVAS